MKIPKIKKIFSNKSKNLEEWYKLADFLGIDKNIDKDERLEATYFACLKILSESIGKLPIKLMKSSDGKGPKEARKHPLYAKLRYRPNRYMTATIFKSTIENCRNHYGNAYVLIVGYGNNMQLIPLDSSKVNIYYDDGKLLSDIPDIWYTYPIEETTYKFSSEEILHFKTSDTTDGIVSKSVRERLRSTIEGNKKAQNMQNKLYESGFTAKAVVQYTGDLQDKTVENFLKNLEKYAAGEVKLSKGIIPIPIGTSFTPLNTRLGDNEFLELKKYSALQIANAFGIKPVQINDYSKSSYASSENQNLAFLVDTLLFILNQYEEELNYKLLSQKEIEQGYYFKFNIAMLLRADHKTQVETIKSAVNGGIYTPNEGREFLEMPSKPGGDDLIVNGTMIKLNQVGMQYQNKIKNKNSEGGEQE